MNRVSTQKWAEDIGYDPEKIYNKLFGDDIRYLLSMSDLWKKRIPPSPLAYGDFSSDVISPATADTGSLPDQKVWNLRECTKVFAASLDELQKEYSSLAIDDHLVWDKDEKPHMDFVAACANIRARIFNIGQKSRFEMKCKLFCSANTLKRNIFIWNFDLQRWRATSYRRLPPQMQSQLAWSSCVHSTFCRNNSTAVNRYMFAYV